jgi:hypothetical protein
MIEMEGRHRDDRFATRPARLGDRSVARRIKTGDKAERG